MKKLLLVALPLFLLASCKRPEASFDIDKAAPKAGEQIQFINTSSGAHTAEWDFGDGTYSNLMNPAKVFNVPGTYNVILTVYNKSGKKSADITKPVEIVDAEYFLDIRADGSTIKHYPSEGSGLAILHLNETEIDTGGPCSGTYGSFIGDGNDMYLGIKKGTLNWWADSVAPDSIFLDFFKAGSYPYSSSAFNGIEIYYYENGVEFKTSGGNQTGSSFDIVEVSSFHNTTFNVNVRCEFTCRVYSNLGTKRTLTGNYQGTFSNY